MSNKKITSDDAYRIEKENNERKFVELMKLVRPELYVIMDLIDQTGVNWFVVVKIIRQLHSLSTDAGGTGWGQVKAEIQNDRVLFVNGEDRDRLDEPLIKKTP